MKISLLLALTVAIVHPVLTEAVPPATSDSGAEQAATSDAAQHAGGKRAPDKAAPASAGTGSAATKAGAPAAQSAAATADRPGPNAALPPDPAQLRANVHAMRVAIEQDDATEQMASRMTGPLLTAPLQDSGNIETLRSQLNESLAHLDNRCIGVNARNNGGNLTLVCGDNNGQVQSSVQSSMANTNIVVPTGTLLPNQAPAGTSSSAPVSGASP